MPQPQYSGRFRSACKRPLLSAGRTYTSSGARVRGGSSLLFEHRGIEGDRSTGNRLRGGHFTPRGFKIRQEGRQEVLCISKKFRLMNGKEEFVYSGGYTDYFVFAFISLDFFPMIDFFQPILLTQDADASTSTSLLPAPWPPSTPSYLFEIFD